MQFGATGDAIELVPPSQDTDYWCANFALLDERFPGFNFLILVRDIGDGISSLDEFSFAGDFGATCAGTQVPPANFDTILGGDFRTKIRTK
jgi:hypothetical protein